MPYADRCRMQARTRFFGAILAVVVSAPLLSGCNLEAAPEKGAAQAAPPPPTVSVVTLAHEALPIVNELPGRIAPTRVAEVRPRVSGIVIERVYTQGSTVKEGDVLYRIDPEPFRVRVASAQATLQRAEATRLQAQQTAARVNRLEDQRVASGQQRDNAVASLAQAEADVAIARAELATAQLDLEYADVKAPISGVSGRAAITEGALVSSAESLTTIHQLDPVYADFTQSVNELRKLRASTADGSVKHRDEATVRLLFDDGTPYQHDGVVLFSEATVDQTTGQVTLRGQFPNPTGDLMPGMYVRVQVEQGLQPAALAVPQQAVQRDPGGLSQVYVVGADDVPQMRTVTTGRTLNDRWVIDRGLEPGDKVIVEGFQKLRPGAKVQVKEWTPAGASSTPGQQADAATPNSTTK